jgi:hypothetical protein
MTRTREQMLLDLESPIHGSRAAASIVGNLFHALIETADPAASFGTVCLILQDRDVDALARAVADLLTTTEEAHVSFRAAARTLGAV